MIPHTSNESWTLTQFKLKYNPSMKKLLVILFVTNLISISYANYLDDWSNDDLCGWMDSTSIPEYILEEVDKRESPDPSLIPEIKPDTNSDYSY